MLKLTQPSKGRDPNLGPSDSTIMLFPHTSVVPVNTTHKKNIHKVPAGSSMGRCNSAKSEAIFKKTKTYWWRGKATGWGAATGASRHRAGIHRHRDRAGWGRKHR